MSAYILPVINGSVYSILMWNTLASAANMLSAFDTRTVMANVGATATPHQSPVPFQAAEVLQAR